MTKRLRLLILLLSCTFLASPVNAAVEVGNFVWEDLDKDGIQDAGEPGVRGATVQLWNSAVTLLAGSAVTDAAGRYQMTVPDNAQYRMRVILPYAGDRFTLANVGSDSTDSDIVPGSTNIGLSGVYTFAAGRTTAQTLDAGVISDPMKDHNIGDYVFKPEVNGLQGSWSVNNATVELMNAAGTVLQTTTSNVDGHYSFKAPPGTYRMRFTHSLYRPSPWKDQGSDDTVDSDIDEDGYTDLFTVTGSTVRKDIDAGFVQDLLIGNFVWEDLDRDGVQDLGEPGLEGIPLELWNATRTRRFDTTTSGPDGEYRLIAPGGGDYRVRATLPYPGDTFSPKHAGTQIVKDSDINPSGVNAGYTDILSYAISVLSVTQVDVGVISDPMKDHNIGDFVFRADVNGLQRTTGRNGVTVELMNPAGAVLQTTTSSSNGHYSFKAPPGTYRMRFTHSLYRPSPWKDYGSDDTIDNDIDEDGYTDLFTVASGVVRRDIDAGFVQDIYVGNFVWSDLDADGVQDEGEPGLANVGLELWDAAKLRRWDHTVTDAAGAYRMIAPGPGEYRIFVLRPLPADVFSPTKTSAADVSTDSDIIRTGEHYGFTEVLQFEFGLLSLTSLDAGITLAEGRRNITPFEVTGLTRGSSSATINFTGPSGGTYKIERTPDLKTWTEAVAPFVSTASSVTRSVSVPAGQNSRHFFRVRRTR